MNEINITNFYRKDLWRKTASVVCVLASLTTAACDQPPITEGTIYRKEHAEASSYEEPIVLPMNDDMPHIFYLHKNIPEKWEVYIAQCQKGELPLQERIISECRTNSFAVSRKIYNSLQIGQYTDFKEPSIVDSN